MRSSKKRICVVTWFGSANFGTNLQAFALCDVLGRNGHQVRILSGIPPFSKKKEFIYYFLSRSFFYRIWVLIKSLFVKGVKQYYFFRYCNPSIAPWVKVALRPVHIWFPFQIKSLVDKTDCFISGSDQIWNTYVAFDPTMFLAFAGEKKRISYSSSLGASGVEPSKKDEMKRLLKKFTHISVREASSVSIINELLQNTAAANVLDPTLLLSYKDWVDFSRPYKFSRKTDCTKFVFCYLVGDNEAYKDQVVDVWRKSGIEEMVLISMSGIRIEGAEVLTRVSPPEFVWLIKNATLICTDSFHATTMGINLKKAFVELIRFNDSEKESQNSRIYDLLARYGLVSRIYDRNSGKWLKEIDYSGIYQRLCHDRIESKAWLLDAIEN